MAKIFDPSGETEFFEVTELQQAFEKELKTGEKVTFTAGVKEGSILREAPIRADLVSFYQEFKDRILNPYIPPQIPVTRFRNCIGFPTRKIGLYISLIASQRMSTSGIGQNFFTVPTFLPTPTNYSQGGAFWTTSTSSSTQDPSPPNPSPPTSYTFANITSEGMVHPTPTHTAYTIPNWFTLKGYVENWNPDATSGDLSIDYFLIKGFLNASPFPVSFSYQLVDLKFLNIITDSQIFNLTADLYMPAYNSVPDGCAFILQNFNFTNLYP